MFRRGMQTEERLIREKGDRKQETRERAYRLEKEEEGKREKEREGRRTEKGEGQRREAGD
jgi:hypothetical protein